MRTMIEPVPSPSCLITNGGCNNTTKQDSAKESVLYSVITYYQCNNHNNVVVSSNVVTYPTVLQTYFTADSLLRLCCNNGVSVVISNTPSQHSPFVAANREVRCS